MVLSLGVDWGRRRTGLALSDPEGLMAFPLAVLHHTGRKKQLEQMRQVLAEKRPAVVVIGHPLSLEGEATESSIEVERFARKVEKWGSHRVVLWDERFTTSQATGLLREGGLDSREVREVVDQAAAVLILQSYLDHERDRGSTNPGSESIEG